MWIKHGAFLIIIHQINVIVCAGKNRTTSFEGATMKTLRMEPKKTTPPSYMGEAEQVPEVDDVNEGLYDNEHYRRRKRQSGAGKYVDTAAMDQVKMPIEEEVPPSTGYVTFYLNNLSEGLRMANDLCDFFKKIDPSMERSAIFKRQIANATAEYQSELKELLKTAKQGKNTKFLTPLPKSEENN